MRCNAHNTTGFISMYSSLEVRWDPSHFIKVIEIEVLTRGNQIKLAAILTYNAQCKLK